MTKDDGNGTSTSNTAIWRWIIGIIILVQMSLGGWLANKVEKMESLLYAYRAESNVTLLQERLSYWIPVVKETHEKTVQLDKEISNMRQVDASQDKRIDRLEAQR